MHTVTIVDVWSKTLAGRFDITVPRIPVAGEFILVGEAEYRIEEVHFCCDEAGDYDHTWLRALKTPPDVDDSFEDS